MDEAAASSSTFCSNLNLGWEQLFQGGLEQNGAHSDYDSVDGETEVLLIAASYVLMLVASEPLSRRSTYNAAATKTPNHRYLWPGLLVCSEPH